MKTTSINLLMILFVFTACNNKSQPIQTSSSLIQDQFPQGEIIDLTHAFSDETIYWVTSKEFELDVVYQGQTEKGYYYSANNFATAEHGGTHIDAPIHFSENSQTVDEIPLENLIGHGIKINVSAKALNNRDYLISIEDFTNWETEENMEIPDGSIVLLQTGFSQFYPDKIKYLGTAKRGPEAIKLLHFPGLSPQASEWLVKNRNIHAIGIDTPSIDYGQSQYFESHVTLMGQNIPAFENLTNLHRLPNKDFYIVALPMKIKGGSGAPLRIVAYINK